MIHAVGCTKQTKNCLFYVDFPEQPVGAKIRPQCCTLFLLELLDYTQSLLKSLNITCWLDFGSLLGAYRNGEFISWDCDVDMCIFLEDANLLLKNSMSILDDGYLLRYRLRDRPMQEWVDCDQRRSYCVSNDIEIFRIQLSKTNKLHIDLFPATKEGDTIYRINKKLGNKQRFPEIFCDWGDIELYGRKFICPSPASEYLKLMYGDDYMTPKRMTPKWE